MKTLDMMCAMVGFAALTAQAENLPDPTRPPVGYAQGVDAVASGPVLQSVLISSSRRFAIISGKTVRVGDKFGDARVASISEGEVVLQEGKKLNVLHLFQPLRKTAPATASGRPDGKLDGSGQQK